MTMHVPHVIRRGSPILALALVLALSACGGAAPADGVVSLQDPSASPDPSAAPSASVDPEDAMLAFTQCMKEHGIDIQVATETGGGGPGTGGLHVSGGTKAGDPQPATGPLDTKAMQEADKACRDLLPQGGMLGDPSATMDPALADQALAFAKCMREHGIDYPDPVFNGGGMTIQIGGPDGEGGVDPMSKAFQAAQEACGKDMPEGGPMVFGSSSSESQP